MFNKILIANRGEIACRIIKTAQAMGIHTVAIYSSVDKESLHVQLADSAFYVGEAQAKDSYLDGDAIVRIAQESGAQAIHPGYGFLSENSGFASACERAGIIFIGPSVDAMDAMASKQLAKQLLESTKVPLIPGYHGKGQSEEQLKAAAQKIGFPVLIKAANGGGGKGMRAVYLEKEFGESLAAAKRESMASFADDTMIIEKLVLNPRHVELQVMADNYGAVVHLFERDCSIQRRHQKIIEEAPAPNLSQSMRQNLAKAACDVAKSINYRGAGTVEFLVDGEEQFYFMEMNTRLQVEHPVTEMITGLDLVSWQLKIAANEPLPLTQDEIKCTGHAIECRIYAEDPHNEFLPSTGEINFLKEPSFSGIRIDTGVTLFSKITKYYDPMIAKLICWGENREEALQRVHNALSHYFIGGVKTNIPFLQAICQHPKFRHAQLSTDFLSNETINLIKPDKDLALLMAISFDYLSTIDKIKDPLEQATISWQASGLGHWIVKYHNDEELIDVVITPLDKQHFEAQLNNKKHYIYTQLIKNKLIIQVKNQSYQALVENNTECLTIYTDKGPLKIDRFNWNTLSSNSAKPKGQLTAPMPATVVAVLKKTGEHVKAGDGLIILEAMKMEHTIHSPADGVLLDIYYAVGSQVDEGAELLSLSETDS